WPAVALGASIEIAETLFWMRLSRREPAKVGPETLIGKPGRVVRQCRPDGEVRVDGERWRARCDDGADVGDSVRVRGRDGLTLLVEAA
ncbi:MAG: NfeD family protein, partial [Candidatus Limnocylindria bacterium]